jgi:predicted CopG family antitoxin
MGRQHTIYMSDVTWEQLQSLKKGDESMSQVIRNAVKLCAANQDTFDLVAGQQIEIDAHKRRRKHMLDAIQIINCKKCYNRLYAQGLID